MMMLAMPTCSGGTLPVLVVSLSLPASLSEDAVEDELYGTADRPSDTSTAHRAHQ